MSLRTDAAHRHVQTTASGAGGGEGVPSGTTTQTPLTPTERDALVERLTGRLSRLGHRLGVDPMRLGVLLTQVRLNVYGAGPLGLIEENVRREFRSARESIKAMPQVVEPTTGGGVGGAAGAAAGAAAGGGAGA